MAMYHYALTLARLFKQSFFVLINILYCYYTIIILLLFVWCQK